MSIEFLSVPQKYLSKAITSAASSFKVNNITSWGLNALGQNIDLTPSDFGTVAYCAFRNDTGSRIEIMEIDPSTIADASITINKRGLDFNGDLTTETSTYKLDWPAGTIVQFGTDLPQLFVYLKEYIDNAIISGAADASETVKGLVEEATDAEMTAGTDTGGTGAKLFVPPSKIQTYVDSNTMSFVYKTTTETVNNSTTLQDDDELFITVEANKDYIFDMVFLFDSGTTPDFKYAFSVPSGASLIGQELSGAGGVDNITETGDTISGSGAYRAVKITSILQVGANAGTVTFQWAQNTANASDTNVSSGSYISYKKLN
jgi:hypothetical protein